MYRITRLAFRHQSDSNPTSTHLTNIDCDEKELIVKLLPKLKKLAAAENLNYRGVGSDTRIKYHIKDIQSEAIDNIITKVNNFITHNVSSYNQSVKSRNSLIKRANKRDCKPSDQGIVEEAKLSNYLLPFDTETTYYKIGDVILVSEGEIEMEGKAYA